MDLSSDKDATIVVNNISSSEDGGTKTNMPYEFDDGVNELGALMKELNIKDVKKCEG